MQQNKIWMEPEPIRKLFKQLINEEIQGWFRGRTRGRVHPPKLTYGLKVVMKLMKFGIVMLLSEKKYASYVHEFHFRRNAIVSSVENSLYAPFQINTLFLFTFVTVEQGHVKKVYDLSVRLASNFLLNFKPLDLNTSLSSCFFFFLCALGSLCTQRCDTVIVVQPQFNLIFEFGCYQWQRV